MRSPTRPPCDFGSNVSHIDCLDQPASSSRECTHVRMRVSVCGDAYPLRQWGWEQCGGRPISPCNVCSALYLQQRKATRPLRLGVKHCRHCLPCGGWSPLGGRGRAVWREKGTLEIDVDIPRIRFNWHWRHGGGRRGAPTDHAATGMGVGGGSGSRCRWVMQTSSSFSLHLPAPCCSSVASETEAWRCTVPPSPRATLNAARACRGPLTPPTFSIAATRSGVAISVRPLWQFFLPFSR